MHMRINFIFSNVVISDNPIGNKIPIFLTMVDTATVAAGVQLATRTEYLADVVDLPTLPVWGSTSVRITAQIIVGDGVSNADWELECRWNDNCGHAIFADDVCL